MLNFLKPILISALVIGIICYSVIHFLSKNDGTITSADRYTTSKIEELHETRVEDLKDQFEEIRDQDRRFFESKIKSVENNRSGLYVIIGGSVAFLLIISIQLMTNLSKIDPKVLVNPEKYRLVEEREYLAMEFVRLKLMEHEVISDDEEMDKQKIVNYIKKIEA